MPTGFANLDRRAYERAALGCVAVLGALAIWLFVRLIWLLIPRGDAALTAASARVSADQGPVPAQSIAKWHLFGNTPIAATGAGASLLAMTLRGTLADRDPADGIAVIDGGTRGEVAFRAGEDVAPGIKLARVYPDHVVLVRDGVEETLKLTRDENLRPADIVRPAANNRSVRTASGTTTNAAGAASGASQTVHVSADTQQTIDRLRDNPDELVKRVQIVPVLDNGHLSGVRVSAGTDMALMDRIGLRAGDIVTAVNGAPVDSIARGQQIIDTLRTASSARVTVLRDGKPTDINISLK